MNRPLSPGLMAETIRATISGIKQMVEEVANQVTQLRERHPTLPGIAASRNAADRHERAIRNSFGAAEIVTELVRRHEALQAELALLLREKDGVDLANPRSYEDGDELVAASATQHLDARKERVMPNGSQSEEADPLASTAVELTTGASPRTEPSTKHPKQQERIPHNTEQSSTSSLDDISVPEALTQLRQTHMGQVLTEHPEFLDHIAMWRRMEPSKWAALDKVCGRPSSRQLRRMLLARC